MKLFFCLGVKLFHRFYSNIMVYSEKKKLKSDRTVFENISTNTKQFSFPFTSKAK